MQLKQRQPRHHDAKFLAWLRRQPCCICGTRPSEASHIRIGNLEMDKPPTGMAEKPSDFWALPICARDHREGPFSLHNMGEENFYARHRLNAFALAIRLYREFGGTGGKPRKRRTTIRPRLPKEKRAKIQSRPFQTRRQP